jgi:hypothetical protein
MPSPRARSYSSPPLTTVAIASLCCLLAAALTFAAAPARRPAAPPQTSVAPARPFVNANPWNNKVVLQAFWWDCENARYPNDWYTYLAKLAPRLKAMGFDAIYLPPPSKGNSGTGGMGYDLFDHYDIGGKNQKGSVGTRFGTQDSLLRLVAVAHANGLDVHHDIVLNHVFGGEADPNLPAGWPGDKHKRFRYAAFGGPGAGPLAQGVARLPP